MADNAETPTITASESKVLISMMKHLQGDITVGNITVHVVLYITDDIDRRTGMR